MFRSRSSDRKLRDPDAPEAKWETTLDYRRGYGYVDRWGEVQKALEPLIHQLRAYDALRRKLEEEGGRAEDLTAISDLLNEKITIEGAYRDSEASLTDQAGLRAALRDVGAGDVHLDLRQLDTRMPVYYLSRIRRDYWSEYSLIVEDLYRSPGHPMLDERFVRLMHFGHETYYLRLSQFRERVLAMVGQEGDRQQQAADEILYNLGRHVFQAAWHDDQRVGMLAAAHFDLPRFRNAIELLYLCLSGELCELRSAVDEGMLLFFRDVYPQPALCTLLALLPDLDGGTLNEIPQRALKLYAKLSRAFGRFIKVEALWGARRVRVPLYELIFGNIPRLDLVGQALRGRDEVAQAAGRLEAAAQGIIDEIVPPSEAASPPPGAGAQPPALTDDGES